MNKSKNERDATSDDPSNVLSTTQHFFTPS